MLPSRAGRVLAVFAGHTLLSWVTWFPWVARFAWLARLSWLTRCCGRCDYYRLGRTASNK